MLIQFIFTRMIFAFFCYGIYFFSVLSIYGEESKDKTLESFLFTKSTKKENSENFRILDNAYYNALIKYQNGDFEDSLNIIRKVIELDTHYYKLRYLAGKNYVGQNIVQKAISHFKTCIEIAPIVPFTYLSLTSLYMKIFRYDLAERVLKKYYRSVQLEGVTPDFQIYLMHAKVHLYNKRYDDALRTVELVKSNIKLYDIQGYLTSALMLEGRIYLLKNQYTKSEISLLWALELTPEDLKIQVLLSYLYYQWGSNLKRKDSSTNEYKSHYISAIEYANLIFLNSNSSQKQKENSQLLIRKMQE